MIIIVKNGKLLRNQSRPEMVRDFSKLSLPYARRVPPTEGPQSPEDPFHWCEQM
jgi:hypothetical protein